MDSLLFVSFLAGVLTILAPCVLPVLPLILAGSIGETGKWYPYIVTLSLAISIVVFTVLLKASSLLLGIPPGIWTYVSWGIVLFLGLTYLFPHAWSRISSRAGSSVFQENLGKTAHIKGFLRPILTGAALGPVFSSCSPTYSLLLATVFPVSFLQGVGYTLVYALGLSMVLLIIARGGQTFIKHIRPLSDERWWFRKILWGVLVVVALALLTGIDKQIEAKLLTGFNVNTLEQGILEKLIPSAYQKTGPSADSEAGPTLALSGTKVAPWVELPEWINSEPLNLESLRGKVVVIDFWTYSCINCQRTLPYLVALDEKYREKGLTIIGAHAPEFAFEKKRSNVEKAVLEAGIKYPVVLDNGYALWRAYENRYWPAKYFIDKKGKLRHFHFGEGAYEETEKIIQLLLAEDGGEVVSGTLSEIPEKASVSGQSPETYLGTARRENNVSPGTELWLHGWSISGNWTEEKQSITALSGAKLSYRYSARDIYLVLAGTGTVKVSVDGKMVDAIGWVDVRRGMVDVSGDRMYHLVHEEVFQTGKTLELEFSPGVQAFAFTFWW